MVSVSPAAACNALCLPLTNSLTAACTLRNVSPPMWIAARYSAAVGKSNLRLGAAGSGAVGTVASTIAAGAVVSVVMVCVSVSVTCSVLPIVGAAWWILAATFVMLAASPKAPTGTSDNSTQSAAVIIMRPASSKLNCVGFTPTLTWSMVPSAAITSASLPSVVALILALKSIASGVSTRSVTTPTGWLASWYINSRGALPSTGKLPGLNITSVLSVTTAKVLYGTATPLIVRRGAPSLVLSMLNCWACNLIMCVPLLCKSIFGFRPLSSPPGSMPSS